MPNSAHFGFFNPPCQAAGASGPSSWRKQLGRLTIAERGGGHVPRQILGPGRIEARGLFGRGPARGQRVAHVVEDVEDAAALDAVGCAPGPVGVDPVGKGRIGGEGCSGGEASHKTIVRRVRVDEQTDGAMLGRDLGLDAAERDAVAREGDLALDADAHFSQLGVIFRHAVVDVDHITRHITGRRVGVVGRDDTVEVGLPWQRILFGLEFGRSAPPSLR